MITSIAEKIPLADGNSMPGYGYGCYKLKGDELRMALTAAWEAGYRLFDTAAFYENEDEVGKALGQRGRQDYFLVSKIWPTAFGNPVKALDGSLARLGVDYLDAYLLHWPGTDARARLRAYEILLREKEKGKIRSLGVSKFLEHHLGELKREFGKYPPVNQIEVHPSHQEKPLCAFCAREDIAIMAWAPLGRAAGLSDPVVAEIASQIGKSSAQVILRWHIQENRIPIPKSAHARRIVENASVFDFELSEEQMRKIAGLDRPEGRMGANPDTFGG